MNKKADVARVYFPPDANCLLSVMDHCLRSHHYVNVMTAQSSTKQSNTPEAKDDLKSLPLPEVEKHWGRRRIHAFFT